MPETPIPTKTLDVRGFLCPIPATKAEQAIQQLAPGEILEIQGDDPAMKIDIPAWASEHGHQILKATDTTFTVQKG